MKQGERGFTLVEILLALGVGVIVIVGMFQAFNTLHKWWISTGIRSEMRQNARAGMETLTRDIEMAGYQVTPYGDVNKTGLAITLASTQEIEMDQQRPDNATLNSANPVYEPQLVYYHLATDLRTGRQNLYRQIRAQPGLPTPDEIVAENVGAFVLTYLDRNNNPVECLSQTINHSRYTFGTPRPTCFCVGTPHRAGCNSNCQDDADPTSQCFDPPAGLSPDPLKNIRRITVSLTTIPARSVPFGPAPKPYTLTASVMPQNLEAEAPLDRTPPSVPTGLAVEDNRSCSNKLLVKWNANPEEDRVDGYYIFYGPTDFVKVPVSALGAPPYQRTLNPPDLLITKFADRIGKPNTYDIQILAIDAAQLRSEKSAPVSANPAHADHTTIGTVLDTTVNPTKPRPPAVLDVTAAEGELVLSWPEAGQDTVGYRLYRSTTPFGASAHIDGSLEIAGETVLTADKTSWTDKNLAACADNHQPLRYYYAVATVNCDETLFGDSSAIGYRRNGNPALSDYATPRDVSDTSLDTYASPLDTASPPPPVLDGTQAGEKRVTIALTNPLDAAVPDFDRTEIYWNKGAVPPPHLDGTLVVGGTLIPNSDGANPAGVFTRRGSQVIVFDRETAAASPLSLLPGFYGFLAISYDKCGNISTQAQATVEVTSLSACVDDPVGPPPNLFADEKSTSCQPETVVLSWKYTGTATVPVPPGLTGVGDLAGFRVWRRTQEGAEVELTAAPLGEARTSWTDTGLQAGEEYTYFIVAADCLCEQQSSFTSPYCSSPLEIGPVDAGGLRRYETATELAPENFVSTVSDDMDPAVAPDLTDPLLFTYHNNVKLWLQNTSKGEVTIEKMAVVWDDPSLLLSRVILGSSAITTTERTIFEDGVASGVEFAVNDAVIGNVATAVGSPSAAVPLLLRFTTLDGSVNRLVDLRGKIVDLLLWPKNEGFTTACSTPTKLTIEVPRGPELGSFSQSKPARDGIDSYAVTGPSHTARDTDIKVSTGVGVNIYGTVVDHSGMLFSDRVNRGFEPAKLRVLGTSAGAASATEVPTMPTMPTSLDFQRQLQSLGGDRYAIFTMPPCTEPSSPCLMPQRPDSVRWYYALAVDKTGNWDRLPNPDYGNYAYFQTEFDVCRTSSGSPRLPREPVGVEPLHTTVGPIGVVLTWTAPALYDNNETIVADDMLTYDVYYNKDGEGWNGALNGKNRSSLRYDHLALSDADVRLPAGTYRYMVQAKNSCIDCAGIDCTPLVQGGCCSAPSNEKSIVVPP